MQPEERGGAHLIIHVYEKVDYSEIYRIARARIPRVSSPFCLPCRPRTTEVLPLSTTAPMGMG